MIRRGFNDAIGGLGEAIHLEIELILVCLLDVADLQLLLAVHHEGVGHLDIS